MNKKYYLSPKKAWTTPVLTEYGAMEQITEQSIPQKIYGGNDGAVWNQQSVGWSTGS
jgi:hypothetical protein